MRTLVWFRSDLRVRDNPALTHALRAADRGTVAVFIISAAQWREHDWGAVKVDFVLRNVRALGDQLAELGIALKVLDVPRFRQAPARLIRLAKANRCDALYFNREHEVNESRRDDEAVRAFEQAGLAVHSFEDQTVVSPGSLRTQSGHFYSVFTPFRRAWLEAVKRGLPLKVLTKPRRRTTGDACADQVPRSVAGFGIPAVPVELWPGGEEEAVRRLQRFVRERIATYQRCRDLPAEDATSTLSPYLACGAVSARQCLVAALRANDGRLDTGRTGAVTWITQLIWRDFYRHILVGFPRVGMNRAFKTPTDRLPWRHDDEDFQRWCNGQTGVPIVDAAMRQLLRTGWMHNRLRMVVSMFLAKDLFIDWRWGERFFMQHLVDADLANNNGGWQWAASTGTDAAPYFRVFNPYRQSRRFDPKGRFIRRYYPELANLSDAEIHEPAVHDGLFPVTRSYPPPMVDHGAARQRVIDAFKALAEDS